LETATYKNFVDMHIVIGGKQVGVALSALVSALHRNTANVTS